MPTPSPTTSPTRSARPFALERFTNGALIDEHGAAAVAH
jgi:sarcosine oxidase subunit beta